MVSLVVVNNGWQKQSLALTSSAAEMFAIVAACHASLCASLGRFGTPCTHYNATSQCHNAADNHDLSVSCHQSYVQDS